MEIGAPVSMACIPRCMPSVGFIATRAHAALAEVLLDLADDVQGLAGVVFIGIRTAL